MKISTSFFAIMLIMSSCTNDVQKSKCIFIENHSSRSKIVDMDSACHYANKANNTVPLFIYLDDSLPSDKTEFYHFSSLKNQSVENLVALFIDRQNNFTVVYSENLKADSLLAKRYDFGRFIYEDLKRYGSRLEITAIHKKFAEIFLSESWQQ